MLPPPPPPPPPHSENDCLRDTEALKYPPICMSPIFETDEAKNYSF